MGAAARLAEVEIICSDPLEHRRRVEGRFSDITGLVPPSWEAVLQHHYEPWEEPHVIIDTARLTPDEAVSKVERCLGM